MRRDTSLGQLTEIRVFAGFRVGGGGDDAPDILPEFIRHNGVKLLVSHAHDVFLRRCGKLQPDGGIRYRSHEAVDQAADRPLDPGSAKRPFGRCIPDQRLHKRAPHFVPVPFCCPACPIAAEHNDSVIRVHVYNAG